MRLVNVFCLLPEEVLRKIPGKLPLREAETARERIGGLAADVRIIMTRWKGRGERY